MKYLILAILAMHTLFGAKVTYEKWKDGISFSQYLSLHNVPPTLLSSISEEDQTFLSDIRSNSHYYEAKDADGTLLHALIPIGKEMQIHLYKDGEAYGFDIIPIEYKENDYYGKVEIKSNPYADTQQAVNQQNIAKRVGQALKGAVNTKKFQPGDEIAFVYQQRTRLGKLPHMPDIKVIKVMTGGKEQFIYVDEEGYGYDDTQKSISYQVTGKKKVVYARRVPSSGKEAVFGMPLHNNRVTSPFSYRRWHPVLRRYRPHHGTDFGARKGTPILAVNDGRVIDAGWKAGYGNTIRLQHTGGYVSLYAHLSKIRCNAGRRVKKGEVIGYTGNTGVSSGPHLHFGLMKQGRWMDPMKVLRKESKVATVLKKITEYKNVTTTKYKKVEIKDAQKYKKALLAYQDQNASSHVWGITQLQSVYLNDREKF